MKAFSLTLKILLLLLAFMESAGGQQIASLRVIDVQPANAGAVHILAMVSDAGGRRVDGLGTANFSATVGNQRLLPDSVERVDDSGAPMSIILLLDTSGSMNRSVLALREAAAAFVKRLAPEDSCSLMTFGDGVKTVTTFTTDKAQLLEPLKTLQARDAKTYLYQAIDDALNRAAVSPSARSAIVLLTDGRDEGSAVTSDDVLKKIDQVRVPIYAVGFGSNADTGILRRLAALSHGTFYDAPTDADLNETYLAILDQLKTVYRLSFSFGNLPAGPQTLDLNVSLRGVTAKTKLDLGVVHAQAGAHAPIRQSTSLWLWSVPLLIILTALGVWFAWKLRAQRIGSQVSELAKTVVPPKVLLDVVEGVHAGEKLLLFDDSNTIGRDAKTCQACLPRDPLVGRVHARVFRDRGGQYSVEDLGSQNGTRVNDVAIREPVVLQSGDKISVGMSLLRFTDNR
jgi:VWFA-related protein